MTGPKRTSGMAGVLRSLAGIAGGVAGVRRTRRGTVLVIILGALALISVLTVVYVTVGQGDRRTSAGVLRAESVGSAADRIGDHLARVVGEAALKTRMDGDLLIRDAVDYPFTSLAMRSVHDPNPTAEQLQRRFIATGSYSGVWAGSGQDPRMSSSPYLASTLPRGWDWDAISNISPDGRFVNLWNLAPVINRVRQSGFWAFSSFDPSAGPQQAVIANGRVEAYMSYGLTLLDDNGNPTWPAELKDGSNAHFNIPAHWSMFQQQMFRPSRGPLFYPNPQSIDGYDGNSPASFLYAPYQFCDTDGDGYFDARWFELVNASDPDNVISLLPGGDRFRWFAAARIVDLSGFINVNTATDLRRAPRPQGGANTEVRPLGLYPSDTDLRRVLAMDDPYRMAAAFGVNPAGYEAMKHPAGGRPGNYSGYRQQEAQSVGSAAYDAVRYVLFRNSVRVPDPLETFGPIPAMTGDERAAYYESVSRLHFGVFQPPATVQVHGLFGIDDMLELLIYRTANYPAVTSRFEQTTGGRDTGLLNYGPLRENRDEDVERWIAPPLQPGLNGQHGMPDAEGRDRTIFDIRQFLTTVSWAREIRSSVIPASARGALDLDAETRVNARDALEAATRVVPAQRDASRLFRAYGEALLPHAAATDAWALGSGKATLFYGGHPELALRYAAHLAANMGDSYDRNLEPSAYTLLIDEAVRTSMQPLAFPWWHQTGSSIPGGGTGVPGKLDLGQGKLPSSAAGVSLASQAINVYGVEPQPIISQVASFFLYTDAPTSAGGDDEFVGPSLPPEPITINGTFDSATPPANPDFLGQILAVQLTNPFDVDIPLSKESLTSGQSMPANETTDYYLEFGGRHFKLAETDEAGTTETAVVLRAGETRTFYILAIGELRMVQRFQNIDSTLTTDVVTRLVNHQLGVTAGAAGGRPVQPVRIAVMDPSSGTVSTAPVDLFSSPTSPGRTVHLWRTLRHPTQDAAGMPNVTSNDLLVDRVRDPGTGAGTGPGSTLDRGLLAANLPVNDTLAGEEPPGPNSLDNTGFTIVRWGSLKRRDDPGAAATGVPRGAIPAYCVEAKWGSTVLRNNSETDGSGGRRVQRRDFIGNVWAEDEFRPLVDRIAPATPTATGVIIPTLTRQAKLKTADPIGVNLDGRAYGVLYPEAYIDNDEYTKTSNGDRIPVMRVTDLLLPLAIGPEHDPAIAATPSAYDTDEHPGRITLTEALALALNYSTPTADQADPYRLYHKAGDPGTTDPRLGTLDRGNLVINRFAPFEDANNDGLFTPNSQDRRAFPGIPLALHMLDVFTAMPLDLAGPGRAVPGMGNINTMPREVAVAQPLLAPTTENDPATNSPIWQQFKQSALGAGSNSTLPEPDHDAAAAVIAYRDKVHLIDRANTPRDIRFNDTQTGTEFTPAQWNGRNQTTGIAALREQRGFSGRGELLAVTAPANQNPIRLDPKDQLDGLARDGRDSGAAATNTSSYTAGGASKQPDLIPDNFAEKLIVASGVMNSVSVRSDVFAAWFVIHGYQQSDTENLRPRNQAEFGNREADVLRPSVAKRYLMIIDRSNVERLGQKPRVLLFTEVPMTP